MTWINCLKWVPIIVRKWRHINQVIIISLLTFVKNYYKQSNVSFPVTSQFSSRRNNWVETCIDMRIGPLFESTWHILFRKIIHLFPEMRVTKKIFNRAAANFFFINLIELFQRLHLKNYSNSTFLCWKKDPYLLLFEGKET